MPELITPELTSNPRGDAQNLSRLSSCNPLQTAFGDTASEISQGGNITNRRRAKQSPVLATELRRALVADRMPCHGSIHRLAQHEASRFTQAQILLVLERAHARDGLV